MEINLTTPALLFPTISLLMLAYTNRFLALATLIRSLHDRYQTQPDDLIKAQIGNLRKRVYLIRNMQAAGVLSLIACVVCMGLLFAGQVWLANLTFAASLLLMTVSLLLSVREIQISVDALNLHLGELEEQERTG